MNNFDPIDEALNIEVSKPSKVDPVKSFIESLANAGGKLGLPKIKEIPRVFENGDHGN